MSSLLRLWDTLLSEPDGFSEFLTYVIVAVLCKSASDIKAKTEFDEIFTFLQQGAGMDEFDDADVSVVCSQAYVLKSLFGDSQAHLQESL